MLPKFNKSRREKEKKLERERRGISATLLPKFLCPNSYPVLCKKAIAAMPLPKQGKKEIFFLVIVAMALPKMGGEKKLLLPKFGKKLKKNVTFTIFL